MPITSYAARLQAVVQIHREIASGSYPSATVLGEKLGVSPKTVRKYLELLSSMFNYNPIYDAYRHGYYYDQKTSRTSPLTPRLREDEIAAVLLLEQTARSLSGSPVQAVLESVLDKLRLMMPADCPISLDDLAHAMSLRLERAASVEQNSEILRRLYEGVLNRKRVLVRYAARDSNGLTRRKLDPLHLTRCEGQWYLVAYCHLRKANRTFVPARMQQVELLNEKFERPPDFDPQEHFRSAFGIAVGLPVCEVQLRFLPSVADLIRERQWHATQKLTDLPDGCVRLTMTCSQGPELHGWILSWGEQVVVEAPAALGETIRARHLQASQARM